MATSSTPTEFRIPQEPLPVPPVSCDESPILFVGSDEESFVVLGKSLVTDFEDLSLEEDQNFGKSIIQEAKQLIKDELDRIEGTPVQQETRQEQVNGIQENHIANNTTQNECEPQTEQFAFHSANSSKMEQSSVLPAMPQPQLPRGDMEGNDISRAISIISFAPSEFASEELQTKVSQLIDENVHLKDTILQNNMSMKAQYEKIVAWQKDVEKVHEAHKEKFHQAKQCIETLKKDKASLEEKNTHLQEEIENLRYTIKLRESEHDKSKQIIMQSSENNLKQFELDVANKRIKDLENALEESKTKMNNGVANETANLKAMEEKLGRYEKELEEVYKKNREMEKNVSNNDPPSYLEKLKTFEDKLALAEMAHDQANKEILSLRNQLAKNLQTSEESPKLLYELQQAKNKIAELEETLTSRNTNLIDSTIRSKKSEENLLEANEKIKAMEATVVTLQGQLEEAKIEVWKNKQKLNVKETELQAAQRELATSQYQKRQEVTLNPDEITYLRQQLMQSQMAVTQCDQNRAVAYAQLETQKNEIADLRRQLESKQDETDAMFALKTQLDVYKTDFEAEKEAKEDVKREKNKLSEDLQHLHRRNQQLQEETELLREQLKTTGAIPRTSRHESSSSQGASGWNTSRNNQAAYTYKCPKCQFGFSTLNAVENHVMRCIELEDSLP